MKFALFTKFMRDSSIEEVGAKTKALGFSNVEFPVRGEFQCGLENISTCLVPIADKLRSIGVEVSILATDLEDPGQKEAHHLYEACQKAGVRFLRPAYWRVEGVDYWQVYDKVAPRIKAFEKLSQEHGIKTVIHMHSGKLLNPHCLGTYELVKDCDPQYVGVYYDPAHMALDGEDYELGLGIILDYLSLVAVKNPCYIKTSAPDADQARWERFWVAAREGLVPWPKVLKLLKGISYDGFLCFHAEYTEHSRAEELVADDFQYIRSLL